MIIKFCLFLLLSLLSPWSAAASLGELSNTQLQSMQIKEKALVVDIRTETEWATTGTIPNSSKLEAFDQKGKFDAETWMKHLESLKTSPGQAVILVCRSGNRSKKLGNYLLEKGTPNIYHLRNGIQSWIESGLPVNSN